MQLYKVLGDVDMHEGLHSTFSLGKQHKFRKYHVKLLLFLVNIAFTNDWINYKRAKEKTGEKYGNSRAYFYIQLASEMIHPDVDFETKFKVLVHFTALRQKIKTFITMHASQTLFHFTVMPMSSLQLNITDEDFEANLMFQVYDMDP